MMDIVQLIFALIGGTSTMVGFLLILSFMEDNDELMLGGSFIFIIIGIAILYFTGNPFIE